MDKTLLRALQQLGCNDKHARLYGACMEMGGASLPALAKRARLQRSTAYVIVEELVQKGLLLEDHKKYRKQYVACEPDVLLRMLEAHYRRMGRINLEFKEHLPELRSAHQATALRPKVTTYNGVQALQAVADDVLKTGGEVLLWTNQATERRVFDTTNHDMFVRQRMAKRIPIRVLAVNNPEGYELQMYDGDALRETKLLPVDMGFTSETYIYGDKIAVLDIGTEVFGMIIQNAQVAAFHQSVFESTWSTSSVNDA